MAGRFTSNEILEIKRYGETGTGQEQRMLCPYCSQNRKNSAKIRCLAVRKTQTAILYHCWHCDEHGAIPLEDRPYPVIKAAPIKQASRAVKALVSLTADGAAYLENRGISRQTAEIYDVGSGDAYFPDLEKSDKAVAFPYMVDGKRSGSKLRALSGKAHVCDFALKSLFGAQTVDLKDSNTIVISEGEIDALSIFEAGIPNACSIPNGAQSFGTGEIQDTASQYGFLFPHKALIDKAKRIIIATDNDEPGNKIADELARRIGRFKCYRAKFLEKDANDTLTKHGKEALKEIIESAEPWPVAGLYEASHFFESVDNLFENGFSAKIPTGISEIDPYYSVSPGMLTVVTGNPGSGKSQIIDQLMVNLAAKHGTVSAICSFENAPDVHIGKLCQVVTQKHFFFTDFPGPRMSKSEMQIAKTFVHQHMKFLHQEDGAKSDLKSIIERIKTAVMRWGVRCAVIDPYNYIQRPKSIDSETQWIDEMLTEIRLFAQAYGLHIWFVAHPTKMSMNVNGEYMIPRGFSISGSAAWFAKADFGLTIHRKTSGETLFVNWKTRYDWLGKVGEVNITYDAARHTYLSGDMSDASLWENVIVKTSE